MPLVCLIILSNLCKGAYEDAARKARKMQLLRKFRQWRATGELDATVRCPLCREVLPTVEFERHVKRSH